MRLRAVPAQSRAESHWATPQKACVGTVWQQPRGALVSSVEQCKREWRYSTASTATSALHYAPALCKLIIRGAAHPYPAGPSLHCSTSPPPLPSLAAPSPQDPGTITYRDGEVEEQKPWQKIRPCPVEGEVAMAFWFHDNQSPWGGFSEDVVAALPRYAATGLETACRNGGFGSVMLFVYNQTIAGDLPAGVMLRDANEYLKFDDARTMHKLGVPVAHIADVVRIRAAATEGGTVLDLDLIWLRPVPPSPYIATLYEKQEGGMAQSSEFATKRHRAFAHGGRNVNSNTNQAQPEAQVYAPPQAQPLDQPLPYHILQERLWTGQYPNWGAATSKSVC